jgi:hypothetical protein
MVHNNKVLTVSYGTFSCTLEGFDDSFGTMKAIAEYFRDLASDDRYFGAEPPQPDAEMLARIARREIDRQVEAHSTDSGAIVLRATDAEASQIAAPAEAPDSEAPDSVAKTEPTPEIVAEPVQEPEVVAVEEIPVQEAPEEAVVEADEITEVEAVEPVVDEVVQPILDSPEAADDVSAEMDPAQDIAEPLDEVTPQSVAEALSQEDAADEAATSAPQEDAAQDDAQDAPVPEAAPEPVETAAPAPAPAPAPEVVQDIPVAQEVHTPETVPAADSIAAKLQRIRAVVSQNDAFAPSDDYTEDEDSDGGAVTQMPDLAEPLKGSDDSQSTPEGQDGDAQVSDISDQPEAAETADTKVDDGADASDDDTDEEFFAKQAQDDDLEMFDDEAEEDQASGDVINIVADDTGEQSGAPVQARVVKVKSADLEAAIASGQLEQIDEADDSPAASAEPQEDSSLSPEDEADLMRELAEVEDELTADRDDSEADDNIFGQDIESEVSPEADEDLERDEAAHAVLSNVVEDDEADLSRLMDAADEKLDDPETSTSRETYSQLRGAVAAAEAEKSAGGSVDDQGQDDAYREDLASVVRPRRPAMKGDRTSRRTEDSRPAPLKLVAEQRIDLGVVGVSQRGPVRPRRVMTTPTTPANLSDATGADSAFAEFAERVGATELPELLEAAAAYLSFVEGQDKFSRPQLMNKVRLVKQDDFNREDGLRSFGQLLRDGKIEKRGGGRFAASVEIGFRPDEREAS